MPSREFRVGDTFQHVRECHPYQPTYYAAGGGDFNPIHIDAEVGKAAGLGGVVLHGLCTMAWAAEAAVQYLDDPGAVSKVKVRFSRPVRLGDKITFDGKVIAIEGGKLTAELSARNQDGEDVLKGALVEARLPAKETAR